MTQQTLKPCPFCNGECTIVQTIEAAENLTDVWVGQCDECGCQGPGGENENEAAEQWNKRV